ncbi:flagellar hook-basal body complex protein FliE [Pleionea sp. CnH1-48]|uniref:flagellar hook-basal body complex protein FliE n=1 Tax=Pleionea sp. CnH1-48 TaxID=2954494 RepID=UPI002097F54C|nr:flagellar hook-basal body complex protein FliE [Pleionea sp. CnH1-48]MCO7223714.1 flagellar hook-basal body complex protein FliE [Pleionea sp. CnH1-48]
MIEAIMAIQSARESSGITQASSVVEQERFAQLLTDKIAQADESIKTVQMHITQQAEGRSDMAIHETMIAMEKARLELSMIVEVRNKLVEAYQEVTRMQI